MLVDTALADSMVVDEGKNVRWPATERHRSYTCLVYLIRDKISPLCGIVFIYYNLV